MTKFRDMQEQGTFHAGREYERKIQAEQIRELEGLLSERDEEIKGDNFLIKRQIERIDSLKNKIYGALGDPEAPWYGSDVVSWVGDYINEAEKRIEELERLGRRKKYLSKP